tara:strand:- start:458 stop:676 length:219 start_codon:yes stop_codon:yes gene_type:complete
MQKYKNLKIIAINITLIFSSAYLVEFLLTIKPYILSENKTNFNKKIAALKQEFYKVTNKMNLLLKFSSIPFF